MSNPGEVPSEALGDLLIAAELLRARSDEVVAYLGAATCSQVTSKDLATYGVIADALQKIDATTSEIYKALELCPTEIHLAVEIDQSTDPALQIVKEPCTAATTTDEALEIYDDANDNANPSFLDADGAARIRSFIDETNFFRMGKLLKLGFGDLRLEPQQFREFIDWVNATVQADFKYLGGGQYERPVPLVRSDTAHEHAGRNGDRLENMLSDWRSAAHDNGAPILPPGYKSRRRR